MHRRSRPLLAAVGTVAAATLAAALTVSGAAHAAATLSQVTGFGSNPGALNMYS